MKTKKFLLALLIMLFGFNVNAQTTPILVLSGYGGATSVGIGRELEIDAFFIPADQAQALTWTINNNPGEATIDPADTHCIITGVTAGMVSITATTADGSLTATIDINIVDSGSDIWVSAIIVQGEGDVTTITSQGGTLQMIAVVVPQNATDPTFTWSVENQTGSATISPSGLLTAVSDGTVRVTATANDPSETVGFLDVTIDQTAAIDNEDIDKFISLFPNPAENVLNIISKTDHTAKLSIIDISGKVVKQFSLENNTKSIDISDLRRGLYIVKIQLLSNHRTFQKKLILK